MKTLKLAVNGTLMRGLELEHHLTEVGAVFSYESRTEKAYRLYSIGDRNPAMVRVDPADPHATTVDVEVWDVPYEGLAVVLLGEPEGLTIGKVKLADGDIVLGVIAEPQLLLGQKEISSFGGWRNYIANL